ncbi:MAG: cysteine desulfurase NifS [Oscillospiraceae bacterium]|nr:cysteine desulfurase NifS [Oscillospiraceae bacterium]
MQKLIYADNAVTTRVSDGVLEAMLPFLKEHYGNPSSVYRLSNISEKAINDAREKVANALGAKPNEIYFTSCGTEADNWALKGYAGVMKQKGKNHIITTVFEHHAILHTCQSLEKQGFEVTYLPVSDKGYVSVDAIKDAIREDTGLVTIMYANNEIGTIQPIAQIGALCKEKGIIFHTDAVQAVGNVKIDVKEQNIDMLSLSGHKIHAPKGVGALYVRSGLKLNNLIDGGAQERNRRGGTENVASIVALGKAIEDATNGSDEKNAKLVPMRDKIIAELSKVPYSRLNGGMERLAGNVNMSFEAVEGEALLMMLDYNGICASSGSACTTGSLDPSHVLLSIGLKHSIAHGSLRISLGDENTWEDVDKIIEVVPQVVAKLRSMSPVWDGEKPINEE